MNYRDWLQQVIYKIINPVVHGMIRIGITPNWPDYRAGADIVNCLVLCMPGCTKEW